MVILYMKLWFCYTIENNWKMVQLLSNIGWIWLLRNIVCEIHRDFFLCAVVVALYIRDCLYILWLITHYSVHEVSELHHVFISHIIYTYIRKVQLTRVKFENYLRVHITNTHLYSTWFSFKNRPSKNHLASSISQHNTWLYASLII